MYRKMTSLKRLRKHIWASCLSTSAHWVCALTQDIMKPPKGWGCPAGNSFNKNRSYCYWKKKKNPCVLCPLCLSVQGWPGGLCKPDQFSCLGPFVSCLCKPHVSFTLCFTCVRSVFAFIHNESVFHLHCKIVPTVVTFSLVCSFVHWTSITDKTPSTITLWAGVLTHTGCQWLAQFQQLRGALWFADFPKCGVLQRGCHWLADLKNTSYLVNVQWAKEQLINLIVWLPPQCMSVSNLCVVHLK